MDVEQVERNLRFGRYLEKKYWVNDGLALSKELVKFGLKRAKKIMNGVPDNWGAQSAKDYILNHGFPEDVASWFIQPRRIGFGISAWRFWELWDFVDDVENFTSYWGFVDDEDLRDFAEYLLEEYPIEFKGVGGLIWWVASDSATAIFESVSGPVMDDKIHFGILVKMKKKDGDWTLEEVWIKCEDVDFFVPPKDEWKDIIFQKAGVSKEALEQSKEEEFRFEHLQKAAQEIIEILSKKKKEDADQKLYKD